MGNNRLSASWFSDVECGQLEGSLFGQKGSGFQVVGSHSMKLLLGPHPVDPVPFQVVLGWLEFIGFRGHGRMERLVPSAWGNTERGAVILKVGSQRPASGQMKGQLPICGCASELASNSDSVSSCSW